MGMLPPVVATLLADTKEFTAKMDEATGKMATLGRAADTTGSKFGSFANKASSGILVAGAVVAGVTLKLASNFQTAMTQLVTGAGEAQKNIGLVSKGILDMAGAVGQTPAQLAAGMYLIESAGFHGAAGLQVLKASAQGAKVGAADMATVAGAVTSVLHDYSLGTSKAAAVTSALIETVASGKTHLTDLGNSLGKVLPIASALGVSFQQVAAGLAVQTNSGMSARLASMHLSALFTSLAAPTKGMVKELGSLGLSTQQVNNMLTNPHQGLAYALDVVAGRIKQTTHGTAAYNEATKAALGTAANWATAMAVAGTHTSQFNSTVAAVSQRMNSASTSVQGWGAATKDLSFKLASLKGSAAAVGIGIGDWLLPKASAVLNWINGVMKTLKAHPLMGDVLGVGAATVFGAAVAVKIANGVKSVMGLFNKGAQIDLLTVIARNTTVMAGEGGVGGAAGAAGMGAGIAGGATFGQAVAIFGAGVASFAATTALLHTSLGRSIGNKIVNFGGNLNPLHDLTMTIAGLTGAIVNSTPNKYDARNKRIIANAKGTKGTVYINHRTKYGH